MKQVIQFLGNGTTEVVELPTPVPGKGQVLIQTSKSLVSLGTERMLVGFGQASMLGKIKSQPDKFKDVVNRVVTDGFLATWEAVDSKLSMPIGLGYCNAGRVIAKGEGVTSLDVGDRVVSNSPHAEIVVCSESLCEKIPEKVSDEDAVFTVMASIGLEGIRLAKPELGETVLVVGLGLIGQLLVRLLRSSGCRVLGIDTQIAKCQAAVMKGVTTRVMSTQDEIIDWCMSETDGRGVDAVLVAASTALYTSN